VKGFFQGQALRGLDQRVLKARSQYCLSVLTSNKSIETNLYAIMFYLGIIKDRVATGGTCTS
jgi:hypothetical protein